MKVFVLVKVYELIVDGVEVHQREDDALAAFREWTDGLHHIMQNGYSWFVTDAVAVLKAHPKLTEYLAHDKRTPCSA
jgi:hypothetical protein